MVVSIWSATVSWFCVRPEFRLGWGLNFDQLGTNRAMTHALVLSAKSE